MNKTRRPQTTGRYTSREDLEIMVHRLYARTSTSMADVARICRVSTSTVSKILNAKPMQPFKPHEWPKAVMNEALDHLQRVLNGCRTTTDQLAAEAAAREFLRKHR